MASTTCRARRETGDSDDVRGDESRRDDPDDEGGDWDDEDISVRCRA
jgi:nucleosome binding factor SPN SPT16 subunit